MTTPTCSAHAAFLAWDQKSDWFPAVTEPVRVISGHDGDRDQRMDFIFADGSSLIFVRGKYGPHVFWGSPE